MSGNLLVCEGCTLTYATDPLITAITITINSVTAPLYPSVLADKVKCKGNKVYEAIGFTITLLATSGGFSQTTPAYGVIQGNTIKVKSLGSTLVLSTAVSAAVTVTGVISSNPATYVVTIKVNNAGQTKVKAV